MTTSEQATLKASERKYLRALAHHLKPLVHIGKTGLTPNVLAATDQVLEHYELIKVRFLEGKEQQREFTQMIARKCHSEVIGTVGHVVMFYRQHPDPEKRKICLPAR